MTCAASSSIGAHTEWPNRRLVESLCDLVDEMAAKVTSHGGKIVLPKMAIPGVGYLVYCQDTEGIVFGIMEPDSSAQ